MRPYEFPAITISAIGFYKTFFMESELDVGGHWKWKSNLHKHKNKRSFSKYNNVNRYTSYANINFLYVNDNCILAQKNCSFSNVRENRPGNWMFQLERYFEIKFKGLLSAIATGKPVYIHCTKASDTYELISRKL